jgi:plasmid stabilization system protein ParE
MRIEILSEAEDDLIAGARFYERQGTGLGEYFLDSIYSDIDSLLIYAGIHRVVFGFYRALSKRFPYAIFYRLNREAEVVQVYRVLDLRRDPLWIRGQVRKAK